MGVRNGVEAKCDPQSAEQIQAVLRAAARETYANKCLDGDQAAGTVTCTSEPTAPIGGKYGLN